jgi:hypothetical protein
VLFDAVGGPVIAYQEGSVPEIIEEGVSGFSVSTGDESAAVQAVMSAVHMDRAKVRAAFERRFTVDRMVDDYVALYRQISPAAQLANKRSPRGSALTLAQSRDADFRRRSSRRA